MDEHPNLILDSVQNVEQPYFSFKKMHKLVSIDLKEFRIAENYNILQL